MYLFVLILFKVFQVFHNCIKFHNQICFGFCFCFCFLFLFFFSVEMFGSFTSPLKPLFTSDLTFILFSYILLFFLCIFQCFSLHLEIQSALFDWPYTVFPTFNRLPYPHYVSANFSHYQKNVLAQM